MEFGCGGVWKRVLGGEGKDRQNEGQKGNLHCLDQIAGERKEKVGKLQLLNYLCGFTLKIFSPKLQKKPKHIFLLSFSGIYPYRWFWFYLCRFWNIKPWDFCLHSNTVEVNGILFVALKAVKSDILKIQQQRAFFRIHLSWIICNLCCNKISQHVLRIILSSRDSDFGKTVILRRSEPYKRTGVAAEL